MNTAEMCNSAAVLRKKLIGLAQHSVFWVAILFLAAGPFGSVLHAQSFLTSTGSPTFAAGYPVEMGNVDAASGNLHLEIPLGSFSQRAGDALVPKLLYDSHLWTVPTDGTSTVWTTQGTLYGLAFGTWGLSEGGNSGVFRLLTSNHDCTQDYMLWSQSGTQHFFNIVGTSSGGTCSGGTAYATDSSGFQIRQASWSNGVVATPSVYAPDGTEVYGSDLYGSAVASKDSNGNYLGLTTASAAVPGIANPVIDTVGRKIMTVVVSGNQTSLQFMNAQGGTSTYVVNTVTIPVKTNFQQSGVTECNVSCTVKVITSIGLPDGSSYSFKYDCDSTSGNTACNSAGSQTGYYGTLTSMTLPTGATINYSYTMFGGVSIGNAHNEFPIRFITSKSSTTGGVWSYSPFVTAGSGPANTCLPGFQVGCMKTIVTRPDGSKEQTSFIIDPVGGSWPQQILSYDTDGTTLLSTVNNTWDFSTVCTLNLCGGTGYQYVRKLTTTTVLPTSGGNITKQVTYAYDAPSAGNLTAVKEWKYTTGSFGSVPDRATYLTYTTIGTKNNINHPVSVTICNNTGTDADCLGGGSKVSRTTMTYDGYGANGSLALASVSGATNHDDTNFGSAYTARGNATQVSQWVTGSTYLTKALSYDTTGQIVRVLDSASHATTYSYANAFYDDNGADPPAIHTAASLTNAYVTSLTDAIGTTSTGYYYGTGQQAKSTDYNAQTVYSHYRDILNRLTQTTYPIGWALNAYSTPTQVDYYSPVGDTSPSVSCVSCVHNQQLLDPLGRVVTENLVNNPAGQVSVTTNYDTLNRISSSSHPHIGTTDPNNVFEAESYDGLDRALRILHADGQGVRSAYGTKVASLGGLASQQSSQTVYGVGFPVVSVDEAGKQRQEWIDGFGKVIEVDEPSVNGTPGTGSVTISGTDHQVTSCPDSCHLRSCCTMVWDTGTVSITVNGFTASTSYGQSSTGSTLATALAAKLNGVASSVSAVANGATVTIKAFGGGTNTNFALSASSASSVTSGAAPFTATPSGASLTGGSGGITASPWITTYQYDALGNLKSVVQGTQNRSYQYDGLGRLTQEITPEAGTITLSYGAPGSLCSGNPYNVCSKTAPAPNQIGSTTVTTTYTYNGANQLLTKTHSDTTGTEVYQYGTSAAAFNIGRLSLMTDPSGSESYTYDSIGNIKTLVKVVGSTSYTTSYSYNNAGQPIQITYPSGRIVQYSYDNVGHLCLVAAATSSCSSSTNPYLTLPSGNYDAASRSLSATYGNGVAATTSYSPVTSEIASIGYAKGTTTLFSLLYYYQQQTTQCAGGNSIGNNGQIQCIADSVHPGRSATYNYDSLGRINSASTTGDATYPAWGLTFAYDRYGNRTAQTVTAGGGFNSSLSFNAANNQITGYTYDAAGNITAQPSPLSATYTYNSEECNTNYSGFGGAAAYTCDGNGMRVKKVVTAGATTVSIRSGGQLLAEYDNGAAVNSPTREYLYANNLLATVTGSTSGSGGTITFQHRDHLSPRLFTDVNGNVIGEEGTFPFGESWYSSSSAQGLIFTSYERDAESGNDYALARSYANNQGRFLAPDPMQGRVGDPQSWNRYSYVENDPININDPSGQGFWSDLLSAIASFFGFGGSGGQFGITEGEAAARTTAQEIEAGLRAAGFIVLATQIGKNGVTTKIWGCGSPACQGDAGSAPQGGGDHGDPGTGDPNGGEQGPSGGGAASSDPSLGGSGTTTSSTGGGTSNPSGVDIWNECERCWGALRWAGNFSAGAGEFLTGGITTWINKKTGAASVVDTNSGAYKGGFVTGVGLSVAIPLTKASGFGDATIKVWRYRNAGGFGVNLFAKGEALRKDYRLAVELHSIAKGGGLIPHVDLVWDGIKYLEHWPW